MRLSKSSFLKRVLCLKSVYLSLTLLTATSFRVTQGGRTVVIETGQVYDFVFLDDFGVFVAQGRQMAFNVQAKNDAHVTLARVKHNASVDAYEIVIGGWANTRSTVIRRCPQPCPTAEAGGWWVGGPAGQLNESSHLPFWASWAFNVSGGGLTVRVGTGYVVRQDEFMSWYDPDPYDVNFVGISTGWEANGSWIFEVGRFCRDPEAA